MECYLKSTIIAAGFSRYDFHRLENLAMVAPSMTLWSADQLTLTMYALYTLSLSSNLGNSCERFEHRSHLIRRLSNAPINVMLAGGRAWGGDLIVFVAPGVGHLTDLVLPGEGIFESFFARRGDIWLPTRTKKTETEHMFPASTLNTCAIRFERIRKSWRPMKTSEGWVDFTILSSNFVCFSMFLINWTSHYTVVSK